MKLIFGPFSSFCLWWVLGLMTIDWATKSLLIFSGIVRERFQCDWNYQSVIQRLYGEMSDDYLARPKAQASNSPTTKPISFELSCGSGLSALKLSSKIAKSMLVYSNSTVAIKDRTSKALQLLHPVIDTKDIEQKSLASCQLQ
jgi:hypothetical protein